MAKREDSKLYKLEPPEGGWGILICIGMALPFISALGSMPSFGLVFGDFLKNLGEETSAIAVITSSFFSAMSFAGLFANSLFKKYSMRKVGMMGGILYFIGSLMQIFVRSTIQLMIAFSLFQGTAFGLMVPTAYTTFNNYFVKRRVMMMSFAQSLIGLGIMFYPVVMQTLLEWYGFRGSLAILAAINAHSIWGMLVMHPVKWHMRKVLVVEQELKVLCQERKMNEIKEKENDTQCHLDPLMNKWHSKVSLKGSQLNSHRSSLDPIRNLQIEADIKSSRRPSSLASLGNWTGTVIVSDAGEQKKSSLNKWSKLIVDFLDLSLLKDPIYVNIVFGISFALFSDMAFFTIQPMYLFELGFPKSETASIIAIGAAADLLSRVVLAFGSACVTIPSRYVYLGGSLFTVVARFAFLEVFDFVGMAIMTAIMGFLRTWVHVPLPLVFAEYLPQERFPSGYGLFMFLQGNIMFIIAPIVGYVRDITKSYILTFHCLNFFMALCAFPWLLEIFYCRWRNRKTTT